MRHCHWLMTVHDIINSATVRVAVIHVVSFFVFWSCLFGNKQFLSGHNPSVPVSLPFLPDLHNEVERTWKKPYSTCIYLFHHMIYANVEGMWEHGYVSKPPTDETFANYLSIGETSSLKSTDFAIQTSACNILVEWQSICNSRLGWWCFAHNGCVASICWKIWIRGRVYPLKQWPSCTAPHISHFGQLNKPLPQSANQWRWLWPQTDICVWTRLTSGGKRKTFSSKHRFLCPNFSSAPSSVETVLTKFRDVKNSLQPLRDLYHTDPDRHFNPLEGLAHLNLRTSYRARKWTSLFVPLLLWGCQEG